MLRTSYTPGWMHMFGPQIDFFDLLRQQSETALQGTAAFRDCLAAGSDRKWQMLQELDSICDAQKMNVHNKLASMVATPFDSEEIYDISAHLYAVTHDLKKTAKDIEVYHLDGLDNSLRDLSNVIFEGMQLLTAAITHLEDDLPAAHKAADQCRATELELYTVRRQALKSLNGHTDIARVVTSKEVLDSLSQVGEHIQATAERLLYLTVLLS